MGIDAVVRVKDERLHIVKEAIALFNTRKSDKEWTANQEGNKKTAVIAWDDSEFEMNGLSDTVGFVKFIEKISTGDKVEFKKSLDSNHEQIY